MVACRLLSTGSVCKVQWLEEGRGGGGVGWWRNDDLGLGTPSFKKYKAKSRVLD